MQKNNNNILITGATGFVGTALINRLKMEYFRIVAAILDGEDAGHLPTEIERVSVQPLSESSDYMAALQGMDIVIHLAARVHIMKDKARDPLLEFRRVNLYGTERLAVQAAQAGVKRFIFVSTVKVHGEETATPYRENQPIAPLEPYGSSKAEAEAALYRIAINSGLEVVVLRPPLVYGPGVKANFLNMMNAVQSGIPLPLASIRNLRYMLYVGNLADALTACITHPRAAGQTFLVSDGQGVSTPDLIRQTACALGRPARLFPFPPVLMRLFGKLSCRTAVVDRLLGSLTVDCGKIQRELGWFPPFTMEQGLLETAEWYKRQHQLSNTHIL